MSGPSAICKDVDVYPYVIKGPVLISDPVDLEDFAEFKRRYEESDPCCCNGWQPKHVIFGDVEIRGRLRFARRDGSKPTKWNEVETVGEPRSVDSDFEPRAFELADDWEIPVFPKLPSLSSPDSSPDREDEGPKTPPPPGSEDEVVSNLATDGLAFLSFEESDALATKDLEDDSLVRWSARRSACGIDMDFLFDENVRGFFSRLILRPRASFAKLVLVTVSGFLVARCVAKPGGAGYFRATIVVRKKDSNVGDKEPSSWKIDRTEMLCLVKGSPSPNQVALEGLTVHKSMLLSIGSNEDVSFEVHLHKVVPASTPSGSETSYPCVLSLGDATIRVDAQ